MAKNHLFCGNNLEVMRCYIPDESVDLCYIDPPFNSNRNYNQVYTNLGKEAQAQAFIDTWTWDDHANLELYQIRFIKPCFGGEGGEEEVWGDH